MSAEPATRGRRAFGVRARTTAIAVTVVAVVLTTVAVAVVWLIGRTITDQVRDVVSARLDQLAVAPPETSTVPSVDPEEEAIQVVIDGEVVASTTNVEGRPPIASLEDGEEAVVDDVVAGEGPFLVVATVGGDRGILAARSLDDAVEVSRAATVSLAVGMPIVVAVVGVLTWYLVGRALAPIDAMRAEADRISAAELHRRLPDRGAGDEVGRLARTLNGMLARLEDAQRRQRRFVSDASHELRSPIASIRQAAEIGRTEADPVVRDLGETVLAEATRLQTLVDDLLVLASVDEGEGGGLEDVDVDDLVLAEAERLRSTTAIDVDTSGVGPGRVRGNRRQLGRVFRNVADNAARHARATVAVGVATSDGRVIATIDDDGPGIPPEERLRALERFVRLDEGRGRADGGSGLGLAIVHDVTIAHGGRVALGTSPLGGLRVTVSLPAGG